MLWIFAQDIVTTPQNGAGRRRGRPATFSAMTSATTVSSQEGRLEVGDLVLHRDPQMRRDSTRRGDAAPVIDHRVLHPFGVPGIVDMTHVVDVGRQLAEQGGGTSQDTLNSNVSLRSHSLTLVSIT